MLQLALLLPGGPCRKAGQGVGKSVFFYRRELEAERIGLESYVTAAGVGDRLIAAEEMNIRYLTLSDDSRDARLEWLHRVVGEFRCEAWSDKATAFMSNHTGHYDALIVGGKDAARIVRILRDNFPLLQTKMKICLTAGSSARARAQLIAAGFDDAIDVARIEPVEGVARLRAIWRRYVEWYGRQESERLYLARLAQIVDLDGLSEREKKLIACLELTPGRPVPHATLRALVSHDWEEVSQPHLKVVVSALRHKLRAGVEITAVRGEGYRLDLPKRLLPGAAAAPERSEVMA